jgi:hypothetical protein
MSPSHAFIQNVKHFSLFCSSFSLALSVGVAGSKA